MQPDGQPLRGTSIEFELALGVPVGKKGGELPAVSVVSAQMVITTSVSSEVLSESDGEGRIEMMMVDGWLGAAEVESLAWLPEGPTKLPVTIETLLAEVGFWTCPSEICETWLGESFTSREC